jgi:hypothetical protein
MVFITKMHAGLKGLMASLFLDNRSRRREGPARRDSSPAIITELARTYHEERKRLARRC